MSDSGTNMTTNLYAYYETLNNIVLLTNPAYDLPNIEDTKEAISPPSAQAPQLHSITFPLTLCRHLLLIFHE